MYFVVRRTITIRLLLYIAILCTGKSPQKHPGLPRQEKHENTTGYLQSNHDYNLKPLHAWNSLTPNDFSMEVVLP